MRLTERIIDEEGKEHIFTKYVKDNQKLKDQKLCALEDIEDELGIDLITLFEVLKNGIYFKHKVQRDEIILHTEIDFFCLSIKALVNKYTDELGDYHFTNYFFKNYGKTWALTKEELL